MLHLATILFREFVAICLLRRNPQDLPPSGFLLGLVAAASAAGSLVAARSGLDWPAAAQSALAETVFMLGAVYALLSLQGYRGRWLQTVTAIAGTNTVLVLISLPVVYWLALAQENQLNPALPALLFLGLVLWNLLVLGHILRHALSVPLPVGIMAALGYYILSIMTLNWLIPTPSAG